MRRPGCLVIIFQSQGTKPGHRLIPAVDIFPHSRCCQFGLCQDFIVNVALSLLLHPPPPSGQQPYSRQRGERSDPLSDPQDVREGGRDHSHQALRQESLHHDPDCQGPLPTCATLWFHSLNLPPSPHTHPSFY